MCSRGNMSFIVTEGPAQVGRKAHVVTHPPHIRPVTWSLHTCRNVIHTYMSQNVRQKTCKWRWGKTLWAAVPRRKLLLLLLPLSPAGQEVPPSSTCSHTGIDVTLYSRAQRSPVSAASLPVFCCFSTTVVASRRFICERLPAALRDLAAFYVVFSLDSEQQKKKNQLKEIYFYLTGSLELWDSLDCF